MDPTLCIAFCGKLNTREWILNLISYLSYFGSKIYCEEMPLKSFIFQSTSRLKTTVVSMLLYNTLENLDPMHLSRLSLLPCWDYPLISPHFSHIESWESSSFDEVPWQCAWWGKAQFLSSVHHKLKVGSLALFLPP